MPGWCRYAPCSYNYIGTIHLWCKHEREKGLKLTSVLYNYFPFLPRFFSLQNKKKNNTFRSLYLYTFEAHNWSTLFSFHRRWKRSKVNKEKIYILIGIVKQDERFSKWRAPNLINFPFQIIILQLQPTTY